MSYEEKLDGIRRVGKRYGFDLVTLHFDDHADMKIKWVRNSRQIEFSAVDYLTDMPDELFIDMIEVVFKKIFGIPGGYSKETSDYLLSDEFIEKYRPTYLKRNKLKEIKITDDNVLIARPIEKRKGGTSAIFNVIILDPDETAESDLSYRLDEIEFYRDNLRGV